MAKRFILILSPKTANMVVNFIRNSHDSLHSDAVNSNLVAVGPPARIEQ